MAVNPLNSSSLEQLVLKGLNIRKKVCSITRSSRLSLHMLCHCNITLGVASHVNWSKLTWSKSRLTVIIGLADAVSHQSKTTV